jgi:hypothetical protein
LKPQIPQRLPLIFGFWVESGHLLTRVLLSPLHSIELAEGLSDLLAKPPEKDFPLYSMDAADRSAVAGTDTELILRLLCAS